MTTLVRAPLRAVRRATLWWAVGIAALVGVTVAFWPAFRGSSGISQAIDQLPAGVVSALGLADFGTPAGFLRGNLYELIVPLLLAVATIGIVAGATAGDEAAGRLELLLAQPVDHGRVYLGRVLAGFVAALLLTLAVLGTQLLAGALVGLQIDPGLVLGTVVLCGLLGVLHGAVAYAVAAVVARPGLVISVGVGVLIGGYLVAALFPLVAALEPLRHLSPWDWALGGDPLRHPAEAWRFLALAAPAAGLVALGTVLVRRRDVAVA